MLPVENNVTTLNLPAKSEMVISSPTHECQVKEQSLILHSSRTPSSDCIISTYQFDRIASANIGDDLVLTSEAHANID
jgi:hypothetical protein